MGAVYSEYADSQQNSYEQDGESRLEVLRPIAYSAYGLMEKHYNRSSSFFRKLVKFFVRRTPLE